MGETKRRVGEGEVLLIVVANGDGVNHSLANTAVNIERGA